MINHPHKRHYPIKATKPERLKFIKKLEIVTANDLVDHFGYKPESAKRTLHALVQEGLLTSWISPGVCDAQTDFRAAGKGRIGKHKMVCFYDGVRRKFD